MDFNVSLSSVNATMVLEAILFLKCSFFSSLILRVIIAAVIFHVPRTVPVTLGEKVRAMNPIGCSWQTKVSSPAIDIVSFTLPTAPCQLPTIFVEYSASGTVDVLLVQDAKQDPNTTTEIAFTQDMQLVFMTFSLAGCFPSPRL